MSESDLLAQIILAHSHGPVRLWRQNSGRGWAGKIVHRDSQKLILSPYYAIKLGPPGMADLGGLISVEVTESMIGQRVALYVGIEGKAPAGRLRAEQRSFIEMVREKGGRAGVARTVEEAEGILGGAAK